MKTFNEKLQQAKDEGKSYKDHAMPEVNAYHKELIAQDPKKFIYNSTLVDYICSKENITPDLLDYLVTQVYMSQQDKHAEETEKYNNNLKAQGFTIYQRGETTPLYHQSKDNKIIAIVEKSIDWFTSKNELTGKIIIAQNGEPFFVPKGKRTRGYYINNLDLFAYKIA